MTDAARKGPETPSPEGDATPAPQQCERCGHEMYDRHCKVVCPNCGYLRDCSDP